MEALRYATLDSPLGPVLVAADAAGLCRISFQAGTRPVQPVAGWVRDDAALADALTQLRAYFAGRLQRFELPLSARGTPFQERVWQALRGIPYGRTISYGELARRVGQPTAARAVGAANGRNPLPVVVPCHRVIGASGQLTGFTGGLTLKAGLLALEQARPLDGPGQEVARDPRQGRLL